MFGRRPALVPQWYLLTPQTARFRLSLRGQDLDGARAATPGNGNHTNGDSNSDLNEHAVRERRTSIQGPGRQHHKATYYIALCTSS